MENASNKAIYSIMGMVGLEAVKSTILNIKAKVEVTIRQNTDLKHERFNAALLGNPGTGKNPLRPDQMPRPPLTSILSGQE
jgi:DNA replication protein DnaC